ncbi:hypothetical protein BUE80_DR004075 [Diplocarpon rosae]|nr:hypothetical protein BUE80_DR004075 [Diplocarpon rosae]
MTTTPPTSAAQASAAAAVTPAITSSETPSEASRTASITGTATATTGGGLSGLPKLSNAIQPVTATIPPTANAPFMKQSNLPEGTVFIVVGSILGFMALSVLLWRGLVAWSLHRSVQRASQNQNMADTKAMFRTPPPAAPFYKYSDRDSSVCVSGMAARGGKRPARPTTANGGADRASLFFSPTAGAAGGGLNQPGNRGSSYLPAGYYASGSAAAANGSSQIHLGQGQSAISLTNLKSDSQGYSRARSVGPSPPDSPFSVGERAHMASSSTLNLSHGYGGNERAPSAYLEDMFDSDHAPPMPGQDRAHSNSPARH